MSKSRIRKKRSRVPVLRVATAVTAMIPSAEHGSGLISRAIRAVISIRTRLLSTSGLAGIMRR